MTVAVVEAGEETAYHQKNPMTHVRVAVGVVVEAQKHIETESTASNLGVIGLPGLVLRWMDELAPVLLQRSPIRAMNPLASSASAAQALTLAEV